MFIAALFTITKTCKLFKCPWTDESIKKMWYIFRNEYYSAIKKAKIMPLAATRVEPEILILSEVSQEKERQIPYITYMWNLKYGRDEHIYRTETDSDMDSRLVVVKGKEREWDGLGVWG